MQFIKRRPRGVIASAVAGAAAFLLMAAPAGAETDVYPTGGGTFASDAEGWSLAATPSCDLTIPLLSTCTAEGGHDASDGNPPGSLAATTTTSLAVLGLFASTVTFQSPEFTVTEAGDATLELDRAFAPTAGLLDLGPTVDYTVSLVDVTGGTAVEALTETVEGAAAFSARSAATAVVAGHAYRLLIEAETASTLTVNLGASGTASARFDNVALSVETPDPPVDPPTDPGDDGKDGSDGTDGKDGSTGKSTSKDSSSSQQETRQGTATGVVQSGRRVLVRLSCPARVKKPCRITAQGKLAGKRVTKRRTVKIGKGRSRVVSLAVKPRFREVVAERKRLQIVQKVKTGKRTRTFTRSRPLIQRG